MKKQRKVKNIGYCGRIVRLSSIESNNRCESLLNMLLEEDCKSHGEEIFNDHVEKCLAAMEAMAKKRSENGGAIISFVPGEKTESWNSRMQALGTLSTETHNFLVVASVKSAEMALTLENSGKGGRKPLIGELGYKGGVIRKVKCGYLIASFSGAPTEIDAEISTVGVELLSKYY